MTTSSRSQNRTDQWQSGKLSAFSHFRTFFAFTFDVMLSLLNRPSLKALGESMSSLGLTGNSLLNKQNVMKDSFIKYLRVSYT